MNLSHPDTFRINKGDTLGCAPIVVARVLDINYDEALDKLNKHKRPKKRRPKKATSFYADEVIQTLIDEGWEGRHWMPNFDKDSFTLKQYVDSFSYLNSMKNTPLVVATNEHVFLLYNGKIYDNNDADREVSSLRLYKNRKVLIIMWNKDDPNGCCYN